MPRRFDEPDLGGYWARDTHRGGYGDDYARDADWSGGGRHDDYVRDSGDRWGGTGAPADWTGGTGASRGRASVGYGPAQSRSTFGRSDTGGSAEAYGGHRGRGPKNWRRSDERIREEVSEWLTEDDVVNATDIEVMVENGEVTLSGSVATRDEKRRAEDIAESVRGVHDVHNRLRVEIHIGKASE